MAMRWMVALSCRLPVRERRWRLGLADQPGSGAVPLWPGEGIFVLGAANAGDLGDDLGGDERTDADEREQAGSHRDDSLSDLAFEGSFGDGQRPGPLNEVGSDASNQRVVATEAFGDGVEGLVAGDRPGGRIPARIEFVEVPTKPVDVSGPVPDQVFSMVHEQAEFSGGPSSWVGRSGSRSAARATARASMGSDLP